MPGLEPIGGASTARTNKRIDTGIPTVATTRTPRSSASTNNAHTIAAMVNPHATRAIA